MRVDLADRVPTVRTMRFPGSFAVVSWVSAMAATAVVFAADPAPGLAASLGRGKILYAANCSMCHQVTGRGTPVGLDTSWLVPRPRLRKELTHSSSTSRSGMRTA